MSDSIIDNFDKWFATALDKHFPKVERKEVNNSIINLQCENVPTSKIKFSFTTTYIPPKHSDLPRTYSENSPRRKKQSGGLAEALKNDTSYLM